MDVLRYVQQFWFILFHTFPANAVEVIVEK